MYAVNASGEYSGYKWLKNHEWANNINIYFQIIKSPGSSGEMRHIKTELKKEIKPTDTITWKNLDGETVTSTREEILNLIEYNVTQSRLWRASHSNIPYDPYQENLGYISENAKQFYEDWSFSNAAGAGSAESFVSQYLNGFEAEITEDKPTTTDEQPETSKSEDLAGWYDSEKLRSAGMYIIGDFYTYGDIIWAHLYLSEPGEVRSSTIAELKINDAKFEGYPFEITIDGFTLKFTGSKIKDILIKEESLLNNGLID